MQVFKCVTANPHGKTGLAPVKRRKSLMDHRLEAGATLFQQTAKLAGSVRSFRAATVRKRTIEIRS